VTRGDVIEAINRAPATSPEEAAKQLAAAGKEANVLLLINRRGVNEYVAMTLDHGGGNG
jgi:type II secretory pathway component PulC